MSGSVVPTDPHSAARQAVERGDVDALNDLARDAADAGRPDAAVAFLRAAVGLGALWASYNLGQVLRSHGRYAAAAEAFRVAAESAEGHADARVNLGTILADHLGDPEGAEREFRLAVESGDLDALVNLGLLHLDMGRKDEAFAELLQASKRGDPQATELVAALLAESGDPAAGDMFRRAVRQGQPGALVALATYLGQTDDTQAAEDAFKEAIALGVEDAVNSYGDWLLEEGRLDDAETLYRRALHAGDTTVWRNLGNVLAESPGRREEALQAYLLAMVSGDDAAALNAGMLLEELGRVAEGRALLAQFTVEKTDEAPA